MYYNQLCIEVAVLDVLSLITSLLKTDCKGHASVTLSASLALCNNIHVTVNLAMW